MASVGNAVLQWIQFKVPGIEIRRWEIHGELGYVHSLLISPVIFKLVQISPVILTQWKY